MHTGDGLLVVLVLVLCFPATAALRPKFSWDTLGNMTFFHACNESVLDCSLARTSAFVASSEHLHSLRLI